MKILWHDGVGMPLYAKRLEAGKFIWPSSPGRGAVSISAAQLGYLLDGIDWRILAGHGVRQKLDDEPNRLFLLGITTVLW